MYYKNHGQAGWARGLRVILPDNTELNASNKDEWQYPIDGWTWHDEPPQDYLDWEESNNSIPIDEQSVEV